MVIMLVYADLAVGIPIALFAIALLVIAFHSDSSYLISTGAYESHILKLYDSSQEIVSVLNSIGANYTTAAGAVGYLSAEYNVSVSIIPYNGDGYCPPGSVCRFIPLPDTMYTMVFK